MVDQRDETSSSPSADNRTTKTDILDSDRYSRYQTFVSDLTKTNDIYGLMKITLDFIEASFGFSYVGFLRAVGNRLRTVGFRGNLSLQPLPYKFDENGIAEIFTKISVEHLAQLEGGDPLDERGICVRAFNSQTSQKIDDVRLDSDYIEAPIISEIRLPTLSELAVPLVIDGISFGVLNLESDLLAAFSDADKVLIESIADLVSSTFTTLRYQTQISELQSIATSFAGVSTVKELIQNTLDFMKTQYPEGISEFAIKVEDRIFQLMGTVDGEIKRNTNLFDLDNDILSKLFFQEEVHKSIRFLGKGRLLDGRGITIRAFNEMETQLVGDVRKDPDHIRADELLYEKLSKTFLSEIAVPIIVDKKSFGLIGLEHPRLNVYSEQDKHILESVASNIASVISTLKHQYRLNELHKFSTINLGSTTKIQEIADETIEVLRNTLGFERLGFLVVQEGMLKTISGVPMVEFSVPLTETGITVRTAVSGVTQLVGDVRKNPDYIFWLEKDVKPSISELSVPVKVDNEVMAVLNVESDIVDFFTENDQQLVEIIAESVASSLKRLQELDIENTLKNHLTALHTSSIKLVEADSIDEINSIIINVITKTFGFSNLSFGYIEGNHFYFSESLGFEIPENTKISLDASSIIVRSIKTRESQIVNDVTKDPDYYYVVDSNIPIFYSELAVPIIIDDKAIGVLNIEDLKKNAFIIEDAHLLETFAQHIASAINRLNKEKKEEEFKKRLTALHESSLLLGESISIEQVAEISMDAINRVFGYEYGIIGFVEDNSFVFYSKHEHAYLKISLDEKSIIVRAIKTKSTQLVNDLSLDPDYRWISEDLVVDSKSELVVPILIENTCIGAINIENKEINAYTNVDVQLLETLAQFIASAVSRLRENEHIQAFQKQLEALHTSSLKLADTTNVEEIATMTVETLSQTLGHGFGEIGFVEDDRFVFYASTQREFDEKPSIPLNAKSVIVRSIKTGEIQLVVDVRDDPDYTIINPAETPLLSELCYPILVDGKVVGAINIESPERDAYSQDDVRLMGTLVQQVAAEIKRLDSEAEIREREERYRSLFENSLEGIIITTSDGIIKEINPTGETLFGYDPGELIGKKVSDLYVDPEQRNKLLEILNTIGHASNFELDIITKGGKVKNLSAVINTTDHKGEIVIESYLRDITEEKKLAEELRIYTENLEIIAEERAQDYRALSDNLHIHATSLSKAETIDGIAQITKNAIQKIFEVSRVGFGVIENNSLVFLRVDGTKSIPIPFDGPGITVRAARTGKTQLVNDTLLDPDYISVDTARAVSRSELVVPLVVQDTVMGIIDIASVEVNAFNEQHVKLAEIYANHVVSHIIRLQQLNLLQEQNTKLLELDELKGRFIVTATHELRTPVTSILGYVDFMMSDESLNLSDDAKNDLKIVLRNSMRLAALTNDLLDVQRIQTGRLEIHPKEFDLVELVNQVVEELTPLLQEKNHILSLDIPENLMILGDEIRISQLLINLIRNSDKFTPEEGEISVSIETLGDRIQIRIKDSGIGMTPSDMDKLFKPFPGINHGLNVSSTGLGLSISKGIVDLHEGKIWAESDGKGKGSTFIVELPL